MIREINRVKITKWRRALYWLFRKLHVFLFGVNPNVYIQNFDHIHLGKGVWIASGVSIIARNHDIYNPDKHEDWQDVYIGDYCWIGANAIILPGVKLGPHTIVAAGSVVTKSFPEGYCIIAGNPAKIIRKLDNQKIKNPQEDL